MPRTDFLREPEDWAEGFKNPSKFQVHIHNGSEEAAKAADCH